MAYNMRKSRKEDYVTLEDLDAAVDRWLAELSQYTGKRGMPEFQPARSALLVIDMQRYFLDESSHAFIPSTRAVLPNIKKLISIYRDHDLPVIFTRHSLLPNEDPGIMQNWWGDVIREDDELSKIHSSLLPLEDEMVLRKTRYSAFYGTDLEKLLRQKDIESVVITGVMTHLCCETTAREAFMRDFQVFFVINATATQNEELHLSSLKTLSHGFSHPVVAQDIISQVKEMRK